MVKNMLAASRLGFQDPKAQRMGSPVDTMPDLITLSNLALITYRRLIVIDLLGLGVVAVTVTVTLQHV